MTLRATVADNRINESIFSPGATRSNFIRWPITFGSGDSNSLIVMDQGWYANDSSASLDAPNAFTIVSAAVEYNGTFVPVTWSSSRTVTINVADREIMSDALTPDLFGMGAFSKNTAGWYRAEILTPADAAQIMYCQTRNTSHKSGSQAIYLNKSNTTVVNGVDGVGAFTTTGTAPITVGGAGYAPFFIGTFVNGDPGTFALIGDSILAGIGDNATPTPIGIGFGQRMLYGNGTDIKAGMNLSKAGSFGSNFANSPSDRMGALTKYCLNGIDEFGTNDFGQSGTNNTVAQVITTCRNNWAKLRSYGIINIIRTKLLIESTGSWTSDASQTVQAGWDSAGNIETFNTISLPAELAARRCNYLVNMDGARSPTYRWKWVSTGAGNYATADGTHPSGAIAIVLAADVSRVANSMGIAPPSIPAFGGSNIVNQSAPAIIKVAAVTNTKVIERLGRNAIRCLGILRNANTNTVEDQKITILNSSKYVITAIVYTNPSINITIASGGIYTQKSKTGTTVVSNAVLTGLINSTDIIYPTVASISTALIDQSLYFTLTTVNNNIASTIDIYLYGYDLT